jgi:hypothetical protein
MPATDHEMTVEWNAADQLFCYEVALCGEECEEHDPLPPVARINGANPACKSRQMIKTTRR